MATANNHATDIQLAAKDISNLVSADAIAAFFTSLGYDTGARTSLTAEAIGLSGESAAPLKSIELLSEDAEGFLRVVFVQLRSLTAKSRNDLARVLGKSNVDHLLILTSDFDTLEFVLLDKRKRESRGPGGQTRVQVVPLAFAVERKSPGTKELRTIRRFTWTCRDGLEQYDKLRTTFEAAAFTEEYFCNRALFADHFLVTRLREDRAWRDNPTEAFQQVKSLMRDARQRFLTKGEQAVREQLYEPLFDLLGFKHETLKGPKDSHTKPDYMLTPKSGEGKTAAFVYAWDRWLDGPDFGIDQETSEENPGACVVTALEEGVADWIIVTNGRQWRLYSRAAHSRATNFYEVDLVEALVASGDTDPNEAFRYWWLFYRGEAFAPPDGQEAGCWLDTIAEGSRDYAKQLGERLKNRVFVDIFPYLARGFLEDRKRRLGIGQRPSDEQLRDTYEATLTLLYRLLFLLYAEARDLLPIREAPYREASLKKIKEEIADKGGIAESEVPARLAKAYTVKETTLYDRIVRLSAAMDRGDPSLNVPIYNGGLFITNPLPLPPGEDRGEGASGQGAEAREQRIARFLAEHKVPDQHLALAIDRLARDPDEKTFSLVFIDYKSLEVRHLGSIYEGLLEFKLKVAEEDLTTKTEKKKEKYIPLTKAKPKRGKQVETVVRKGEVFLSNDKAERKASGSYYTPDPIVEYIVEHTVGPVLAEKLEALRPRLRKVRKTFDNEVEKARAYPVKKPSGETWAPRDFAAEKTYVNHQDLVDELFDFRTLDPAMGSGHFLVEAVDFITDSMLTFLNQFPVNPVTFMLERMRRNIGDALEEQDLEKGGYERKLTEVNLLKRHVLKRCIYGVDLNPMAVELAKVSLWLDAFTIGAPLSFLDHHLRCGNSLIGATFKDLEKATADRPLLRINYQPLTEAIRQVIDTNRRADATATEVKASARDYGAARKKLTGYTTVFDLLVAKHFGHLKAPGLISEGDSLDLSGREAFLGSLTNDEVELVKNVEHLARRPDLRFFHWEIEFPEVFFGFEDPNERQLKHKDKISEGSAGFDTVVGNPPYVRQETIKEFKQYLKANYATFNSTNDLYVYFQEQEVRNLRADGRMGMIVANKWLRAGYGTAVRGFMRRIAQPLEIVDFGHSPIFPDADTFPCILLAARRQEPLRPDTTPSDAEEMGTCVVPRAHWNEQMNLVAYVATKRQRLATKFLRDEVWSLEDPRVQLLLDKIRNTGVPLKEYCGSTPLYGIKTGLNDAFIVDAETRDHLIQEDERSAEIIKPLLRGRDIDRWRPRTSNMYLIFARRGIDIDAYPAIKRHLSQFRKRLEPKPRDWNDRRGKWFGRAAGDYQWYELQASPGDDAVAATFQPKLVFQEMAWFNRFAFDNTASVLANTAYLIPDTRPITVAALNSPVAWWYMWRTAQHGKDEVLRLIGTYMENLPMPHVGNDQTNGPAGVLVAEMYGMVNESYAWEEVTVRAARETFCVEQADRRILTWLALPDRTFAHRLGSLTRARKLSANAVAAMGKFRQEARAEQVAVLRQQLELERQLAALVEDAYGLAPEERNLLRATRPIRDPMDVLKARIAGTRIVAPQAAAAEEE